MNTSKILLFVLIFFAKVYYVSAGSSVANLCFVDEEIVFSCQSTQGETISICSSSSLTASEGYLQYRFGNVGDIPSFIFPKALRHPKDDFFSGSVPYSAGGASYLKFNRGNYTYTVFTGIGKDWEKEGLVVKNMGKDYSYLQCDGPYISKLGPELFEDLKLKKDPHESDFEIP